MRYVPKLIPDQYKVFPEYFKGNIYSTTVRNKLLVVVSLIIAIIFFVIALVSIIHPLLALLFGLTGFIILPSGQQWLEQKLRFQMTFKMKLVTVAALLIISLPLTTHYRKIEAQEAYELEVQKEHDEKERIGAEQKEQQRKDSINYYIQTAVNFEKESKFEEALSTLSYAGSFTPNESELTEINATKNDILSQRTIQLVKKGSYKAALPQLTTLLSSDPNNAELLYDRAICYSKTGRIKEAVGDLKAAMQQGNNDAEKLHNKINPVRKHIVGYITRCCDGTTSYARGRGACSWHGGVCNWNNPIYEEYRKYE